MEFVWRGADFFRRCHWALFFEFAAGTAQQPSKPVHVHSEQEQKKLEDLRRIHLTEPLTAKTRPDSFTDVIGQEEGIKALRAAMCGPIRSMLLFMGRPAWEKQLWRD